MKQTSWKIMLLLSLSTPFIVHASFFELDDDAEFEDGFYAGLSLGSNWAFGDWDGTTSSISLADEIHDPDTIFRTWTPHGGEDHDSAKILGNVALGYQFVDKRLYLGGEISGTFSATRDLNQEDFRSFERTTAINPPQPQITTITATAHTESNAKLGNNEFDIDLKPGILLWENFLVFARVGAAFTTLEITHSAHWTETNYFDPAPPPPISNPVTITASDHSHNSKNVIGFRIGAGAEYLITEHLGITIDYIFTNYGKIETEAESESVLLNYNQLYGVSAPLVKVTTQSLMAGIIYHF